MKCSWTTVVSDQFHHFEIRSHRSIVTSHGQRYEYELWKQIASIQKNTPAVYRDTKFVEEITGRRLRTLKEKVFEQVNWLAEDELEMWQIDFYHQCLQRRARMPLSMRSFQDMV